MPTMNMIQALNAGLKEEMRRDDRVVVLGEDVGRAGGVFRVTDGLQDEFGEMRVLDTPLAESGIVGAAIGMAIYGLKPVPEIQFLDFIYPAFDQIVNELAKIRYRSGGENTCPLVIRTPYGGGIHGGHYHSQSSEAYFCHTPGLFVVVPSDPYDAKGLLASAVRGDDPVLFLEPKRLYRSARSDVPEESYTVPIGEARLLREGADVTVVAWGAMSHVAAEAAKRAEEEKAIACDVVDVRSLVPLDEATILRSVEKTGRLVIVYEAPRTGGFGGEIAAIVAEKALLSLEAPIRRVTGFDTPFPYSLEDIYLPSPERVLRAIEDVHSF